MPAQEFFGTMMMTIPLKLVIYQKGFILERVKKKSDARLNRCIICCLYHNKPSEIHSSKCFQEFTTMSKITHTKKVIEDKYMFRSDFKVRQEVNDETQTSISYIKDDLQNYIEKNILGKTRKEKSL